MATLSTIFFPCPLERGVRLFYSNTYSMTGFAENLYNIEELKAVSDDKKVIVENEGVFSISEDLEIDESKIQVDKDFKALVDSIL